MRVSGCLECLTWTKRVLCHGLGTIGLWEQVRHGPGEEDTEYEGKRKWPKQDDKHTIPEQTID